VTSLTLCFILLLIYAWSLKWLNFYGVHALLPPYCVVVVCYCKAKTDAKVGIIKATDKAIDKRKATSVFVRRTSSFAIVLKTVVVANHV